MASLTENLANPQPKNTSMSDAMQRALKKRNAAVASSVEDVAAEVEQEVGRPLKLDEKASIQTDLVSEGATPVEAAANARARAGGIPKDPSGVRQGPDPGAELLAPQTEDDPTQLLPADLRPLAPGAVTPAAPEPTAPPVGTGMSTTSVTQTTPAPAVEAQPAAKEIEAPRVSGISEKAAGAPVEYKVPEEFEQAANALDQQFEAMGPDYGKQLGTQESEALQAWKARKEELADLYQKNKNRTEWAEVAEIFGKALARLGAGLYGMRTGLDVTGADFKPSSWESRYDRALAEYKMALGEEEGAAKSEIDRIGTLRGEYKDFLSRRERAKERLGDARTRAEEKTAGSQDNYRNRLIEIKKFNADVANDAETRRYATEARAALAEAANEAKLAKASKQELAAATRRFASDSAAWNKAEAGRKAGIAELKQVMEMPSSKGKRDTAAKAAITKIAPLYDPAELQKLQDEYGDNYDELAAALIAVPVRPQPQLNQYLPDGERFGDVQADANADRIESVKILKPLPPAAAAEIDRLRASSTPEDQARLKEVLDEAAAQGYIER